MENQINFEDLFDLAEIQAIQDTFAQATGVASIITTVDGRPITRPSNFCRLCQEIIRVTPLGLANCMKSDAKIGSPNPTGPTIQPCLSGGLIDAGASIMVGDHHIANWLIGQIVLDAVDEAQMLAYAQEIGADLDEFRAALAEIPQVSREQFNHVCQSLFLIARQLSKLAVQNLRQAAELARRQQAEAEQARLQAQLLQSQKMEAIGQLAGGVAHDFNNILTAIMGHAGMGLMTLPPDHPARQDLEGIQRSAERAAGLTNQLLTFARRQGGQPEILNLNDRVLNMLPMLRRLIGENIELVAILEPALGQVKIDPYQFEQVLLNLVVNARDAMPEGGKLVIKTLNVHCNGDNSSQCQDITPGDYVTLLVNDNGMGMPKKIKEHIFEPFFTTKEIGRGTGLGLATCFGVVRQHYGYIWVESEPGRGATFQIYLPRVKGEAGLKAPVTPSVELPGGTETILLVEDEPVVRMLAARVLREQGYTILEATNGMEALQLLEDQAGQPIQLLLTDMIMPFLGGLKLAEQLRSRWPGLKVLLMSGYPNGVALPDNESETKYTYLQKPFTAETLARQVRQLLEQ
jgi:signal transduction histidine kinase